MAKQDIEEGLIAAAAEILRPIVVRLLSSGVPFGRLEARLRELFMRVAEQELALPGRPQTDSRMALLTGINRKEVRRIRSTDGSEPATGSFSRNQAAALISRWLSDPRTTDRAGRRGRFRIARPRGPASSTWCATGPSIYVRARSWTS